MPKKKITIEDLATLVQKGFKETAKKTELEDLAVMVKHGFDAVDKRMATKEDLRNTEEKLTRVIDGVELKISAYASSWSHDFQNLHEWIKDLEERMEAVEKKVLK